MEQNMKIQSEAELVSALAVGLKKKFRTDTFVQEFAAGYGIADLAFAKNFLSNRNSINRVPIDNYYALKAYLRLPSNEPFFIEDIMKVSGTSKSMSKKIANTLVEHSYFHEEKHSYFKLENQIVNPIKKLVAIEAKLKDWKQGIMQARRYKSYTDECYLAILADYEKNIDLNYLKQFGVGLILFDQNNGQIQVKIKPAQNIFLSIYEESLDLFARELFLYKAQLSAY